MRKMTVLFLLSSIVGLPYVLNSQVDTTMTATAVADTLIPGDKATYNTWTTPVIRNDMTMDSAQHKRWRMGQEKFPARPKDMWELGIHFGHFFIDGDVDRAIPGGYGLGLHLRKAIHYVFSIRIDAFYGRAYGLDPQAWEHHTVPNHNGIGGGLVEPVFDAYSLGNGHPDGRWFPSHRTTYVYGAVEGVLNIGNLLFHKERNKWNWYWTVGVGLDHHKTELDLLDGNGNPYANLRQQIGWTREKFDSRDGRVDIKKELRDIYDGEYETEGHKKSGIFRIGDDTNIHIVWLSSMGLSRKINKRFNIGLEHQVMVTDNDYLDGIRFRSADDLTQNVDISHYTNIRLSFNLGSFDDKVEPLYWLNPLDAAYSDLAELKRRPKFDLTDTDGDGVIDIIDQEPESPAGCPVDTRGIVLDSDGDGIPDCQDQEPFSPQGYEIDKDGIAMVPIDHNLSENDVNEILNQRIISDGLGCCRDWFLPMIHFDLDNYCIKPEFYPHIHHVATVMKQNPDLCVTAIGHTDNSNQNDYNLVLSYNRAKAAIDYLVSNYDISRDRFKLMYGGEESPLAAAPDNRKSRKEREMQQYLNRRVEFRVCLKEDMDMSRPEGPDAGHCDEYKPNGEVYTPSPSSPVYRGNKSAGF